MVEKQEFVIWLFQQHVGKRRQNLQPAFLPTFFLKPQRIVNLPLARSGSVVLNVLLGQSGSWN